MCLSFPPMKWSQQYNWPPSIVFCVREKKGVSTSFCCLRKIPLLRRLSGLWAGNQGRSRAGDAAPSKYPASAWSSDRPSQRAFQAVQSCRIQSYWNGKVYMQNREKNYFYQKTWEMNTTSLLVQKVMGIYIVLHCTLNYIHLMLHFKIR